MSLILPRFYALDKRSVGLTLRQLSTGIRIVRRTTSQFQPAIRDATGLPGGDSRWSLDRAAPLRLVRSLALPPKAAGRESGRAFGARSLFSSKPNNPPGKPVG